MVSGKTFTSATFCFDRRNFKPYPYADFWTRDPEPLPREIPILWANSKPIVNVPFEPFFCDEKPKIPTDRTSKGTLGETIPITKNINIELRSVEEIFLFLGDMVRTELGIANGRPTELITQPIRPTDRSLDLFRVERRKPAQGEVAVSFNGQTFVVSPDPSGSNASTMVIQLLTDLLALNSSAKSLPTPNVIPFLSVP